MHPSQPKISIHSSALWWPLLPPLAAWHFELKMEMGWLEFQFQHFPGSLEWQKHLLGNFGSYFHLVKNGSIKSCCKISQMTSSAKSNALISEFETQGQVHKIKPREQKTEPHEPHSWPWGSSINGHCILGYSFGSRLDAKSFLCTVLGALLDSSEK